MISPAVMALGAFTCVRDRPGRGGEVDRLVEPLQHGSRDVRCVEAPGFAALGCCSPQHQGVDVAVAPDRPRRRSGRRITTSALYRRATEFKTMAKAAKTIKVEQTGSAIRRHHSQRETLIGLNLNKIGRVSELKDTPAIRGMIAKVQHLVRVVSE